MRYAGIFGCPNMQQTVQCSQCIIRHQDLQPDQSGLAILSRPQQERDL